MTARTMTVFVQPFFFSSRRRHTRFDCDWSSDVCSSDLEASAGESLTVVSVFERDRPLLELLDGIGIRPGVVVQVARTGSPIELRGGVKIERADRKSVV